MILKKDLDEAVKKKVAEDAKKEASWNQQGTFFEEAFYQAVDALIQNMAENDEHFFDTLSTCLDDDLIIGRRKNKNGIKFNDANLWEAAEEQLDQILAKYKLTYESTYDSNKYLSDNEAKRLIADYGPKCYENDADIAESAAYMDGFKVENLIRDKLQKIDIKHIIPMLKEAGYTVRTGNTCIIVWL